MPQEPIKLIRAKKIFKITRTITYQTTHYAHSRETIRDLLDMKAPFAWQEMYKEEEVEEIKVKENNETPDKRSER